MQAANIAGMVTPEYGLTVVVFAHRKLFMAIGGKQSEAELPAYETAIKTLQ